MTWTQAAAGIPHRAPAAKILSPGMALNKPTDSLRKPGEGVGGKATLTVSVECRRTCKPKPGMTGEREPH